MAKAPKAPGNNGAGTPQTLIDEFEARAEAQASGNSYWTCHVVTRAAGPIARLAGEAPARGLLWRLSAIPSAVPEALGLIAEGLATRGESVAAEGAIVEALSRLRHNTIMGEAGTIVWSALARAHHALGEAAATDYALDDAHACARRERSNPTQPTPHLARALADTNRPARLLALLREVGTDQVSFDTERSAERAVASLLVAGDAALLTEFHEFLKSEKLYTFVQGVQEGATAAVLAGQGAMLTRALTLMTGGSYLSTTGAMVSLKAMAAGDAPLARALAEYTRDHDAYLNPWLADAFAVIGDDAESARITAGLNAQAQSREVNSEHFGPTLRLLRARDAKDFQARVDAALAQAAARSPADAAMQTGEVALSIIAAGDEAQGAPLLDASITAADAIPKAGHAGWQRNNALESLGRRAANQGRWASALLALKKCSSKHGKVKIVGALANAYARANDPVGVVMALGYEPRGTLKGLMNSVDALLSLAGRPTFYQNHA